LSRAQALLAASLLIRGVGIGECLVSPSQTLQTVPNRLDEDLFVSHSGQLQIAKLVSTLSFSCLKFQI